MEKTDLSEEVKELIREFDDKNVLTNLILLGFNGAIRNIELNSEFDEIYTEKKEKRGGKNGKNNNRKGN